MGLTGSVGSGKSTVSEMLRARGNPVIDADELAREVVQPGSPGEAKVLKAFGRSVFDESGRLDRKKMAALVFSDPEKLKMLESIVHPLVQAQTRAKRTELAGAGHKMAFYDVPLLFEKKLEPQFDGLVVVFADLETCVRRVMARSSWTRDEALRRIQNQLAIEEKIKKSHWVVHNNGTREELEQEVEKLIQDIGRKHS
jgi:dephospho-CoA kinase